MFLALMYILIDVCDVWSGAPFIYPGKSSSFYTDSSRPSGGWGVGGDVQVIIILHGLQPPIRGGDVQVIIASGVFRKTQVGIFFLSYSVQRLHINN